MQDARYLMTGRLSRVGGRISLQMQDERQSSFVLPTSTSKVPSFALFEFIASQSGDPPQANNAKGGSCVVEASRRSGLVGRTGVAEAAKRIQWAGQICLR